MEVNGYGDIEQEETLHLPSLCIRKYAYNNKTNASKIYDI